MKVLTVLGARPQFVKAAAVSRHLRSSPGWTELIVHTGQHYDANMSDVFFDELGIPRPDYFLDIGSGSHGLQTGRMLEAVERIVVETRPDWVLVYGDTNSTLAGALAAAKLHVPVAHVEAGLRSFNRKMPEEVNRVLTDHVSTLLFAPTTVAVENLRREGVAEKSVQLVGDVMYDATLIYRGVSEEKSRILEQLNLAKGEFVLATMHRAENTDCPQRLKAIVKALVRLSEETPVVFAVHPRTRNALARELLWDHAASALRVIDPVGYLDMLQLESHARLIVTDSGGMQKEAFFCRTPCVTLRDETEWVELVDLGWNQLASPETAPDLAGVLTEALRRPLPTTAAQPYGDGRAGAKVAAAMAEHVTPQRNRTAA